MSLTLRSTKGSPLTFGEMDGNLIYLEELAHGGGGPSIPADATFLLPENEVMLNDFYYIISAERDTPLPDDDEVFSRFVGPRVTEMADRLTQGFYSKVETAGAQFVSFNGLARIESGLPEVAVPVNYIKMGGSDNLFIKYDVVGGTVEYNYWHDEMGHSTTYIVKQDNERVRFDLTVNNAGERTNWSYDLGE